MKPNQQSKMGHCVRNELYLCAHPMMPIRFIGNLELLDYLQHVGLPPLDVFWRVHFADPWTGSKCFARFGGLEIHQRTVGEVRGDSTHAQFSAKDKSVNDRHELEMRLENRISTRISSLWQVGNSVQECIQHILHFHTF